MSLIFFQRLLYLLYNAPLTCHRLPLNSIIPFHLKCKVLILFFHLLPPSLCEILLLHRLYSSQNIIATFALNSSFREILKRGGYFYLHIYYLWYSSFFCGGPSFHLLSFPSSWRTSFTTSCSAGLLWQILHFSLYEKVFCFEEYFC